MRVEKFPSQVVFKYKASNGNLSEAVLTKEDPLFDLIEKWCNDNTSGWSKSYDTFAPSFEYRTPDVSLNVRSDFVVANIKVAASGDWIQLTKPTPAELWKELCGLSAIKAKELEGER